MIDHNRMTEVFSAYDIALTEEQLAKLCRYAALLVEWNEKMNLTAITDPEGGLVKHFLDSILPFSFVQLPQGASLIDVGTGAGFPAIPLLIWRPDLKVTLLDSLKKRLTFLEKVLKECELTATVIHSRAEDGGRNPALREKFDLATARAVANLRELSEYCLPYVRSGGMFYALKGMAYQEEIADAEKAIYLLGGRLQEAKPYELPDGSGQRALVCIKKISQTSTKYPRNAAKMAKSPLV